MNDALLALSPQDRKLAIDNAALGLGMDPVILEKDFWVSWLLGCLFELPGIAPHLVFKGGTSLSKVFGVIDRFSEDIDLCLVPEFVGADAQGFGALSSRAKRDAAVLAMQSMCADKVQQVVSPLLEQALHRVLGAAPDAAWLHYTLDADAKSPILFFRYPSVQNPSLAFTSAYVQREVKLEFGTLTDQQPTGRHPVRPLLADAYPAMFADWRCEVTALALQRTFWEKATILHAEFYRPTASAMPDRYARHYFDMVKLLAHPQAADCLSDTVQCARVVDWKQRVFARGWARYELARPGSFRLLPPLARQAALAQDYARMESMFMSTPPPFADLMRQLDEAEAALNASA